MPSHKKHHIENDIELVQLSDLIKQQTEKEKNLQTNEQVARTVGVAGSANLTGIYIMYTTDALRTVMHDTLSYLFFPLSAVTGIMSTVLAWRQAQLEGMKKSGVATAVIRTASTAALTTAVIGGFAASTVFASAIPFIFITLVTTDILINAGKEIYYFYKNHHATTPEKKEKYKEKIRSTGIALLSLCLGMVATAGVFAAGEYALAGVGIAASLIGVTHALYSIYQAYKTQQEKDRLASDKTKNQISLTTNAFLTKQLTLEKQINITDTLKQTRATTLTLPQEIKAIPTSPEDAKTHNDEARLTPSR